MNDRPIDFASLDPTHRAEAWETRIFAITQLAVHQYRRRQTVAGQLAQWYQPMLAIAAGLALIGWVSLMTMAETRTSAVGDPSVALLAWAANDEPPSSTSLLELVRVEHER